MAIEQLGESLLAQAKKTTKKKERKGKIMAGVMLGLTGANYLLRQQAAKRIDELNRGYQPIITQKTEQLKAGVKFWADHNSMLNAGGYSQEQWKDAYAARERKKLVNNYGITVKQNNSEELNAIVQEQIKDDLAAYENEMNAYADFKTYKDTTEDTVRYLEPVNRVVKNSADLIKKNANVGGKLLETLGFRKDSELDDQVVDTGLIRFSEGVDVRDKTDLVNFLNRSAQSMVKLNSLKDGVSYDLVLSEKELKALDKTEPKFINTVKEVKTFNENYLNAEPKERKKLARIESTFINPEDPDKPLTFTYAEIVEALPKEIKAGETIAQDQQLVNDINRVASIIIENAKVNNLGITNPEAIQQALDFIASKDKFTIKEATKEGLVEKFINIFGDAKFEFNYNRLTEQDFVIAANSRPKDLEKDKPFEISPDVEEFVKGQAPSATSEVSPTLNLTSSQVIKMATDISKDADIVNESDEEIENTFSELLKKIPSNDLKSTKAVISAYESTLERKRKGAGNTDDMTRVDGTEKSSQGFLGPIKNNVTGQTMTEVSIGVEIDGKETLIPAIVPTLSNEQIETLKNLEVGKEPIPQDIQETAKQHAENRIEQGLNPFYQEGEQPISLSQQEMVDKFGIVSNGKSPDEIDDMLRTMLRQGNDLTSEEFDTLLNYFTVKQVPVSSGSLLEKPVPSDASSKYISQVKERLKTGQVESMEMVEPLKLIGADEESVRNRVIARAEKYLAGETPMFSSTEFNKWLKEIKNIKATDLDKKDKPRYVKEFLELLK